MEEIYDKYMETPTWGGMFHACEFETSLMLAVKPETVHMERAVQEYPVRPTTYGMDNTSIGELSVYIDVRTVRNIDAFLDGLPAR